MKQQSTRFKLIDILTDQCHSPEEFDMQLTLNGLIDRRSRLNFLKAIATCQRQKKLGIKTKFGMVWYSIKTLKLIDPPSKLKCSITFDYSVQTFQNCPTEITKDFRVYGLNEIKDLSGAPTIVRRNVWISKLDELVSLKGLPKKIGGYLRISDCRKLEHIDVFPEEVKEIICDDKYVEEARAWAAAHPELNVKVNSITP